MVEYLRDFTAAIASPRVADKPLVVKGIQISKGEPSDIMISHADAAKIRGAASNLSFLQKCKVVVVID
jgi:hypothetical protein